MRTTRLGIRESVAAWPAPANESRVARCFAAVRSRTWSDCPCTVTACSVSSASNDCGTVRPPSVARERVVAPSVRKHDDGAVVVDRRPSVGRKLGGAIRQVQHGLGYRFCGSRAYRTGVGLGARGSGPSR